MADPTSITPTTIAKPLSNFHEIGHNTYLYTPATYNPPETPLILLFSWMAAATKHIAKYTVAYQRLFPSARIVLVRCWMRDLFETEATYRKQLVPALDVVKEHTKYHGEILVHSFSNGGANELTEFAKAWALREGSLFPMRAQILDSSPGKGGWKRSHAAMVTSLPRSFFWRLFGSALVHLLLVLTRVYGTIMRKKDKMAILCQQLNDPAIFDRRTPRVYLYSKADLMIGFDEAEEHADEGAANGWHVTKVRFDNSPHTGHVREDEGKYWGAVMEAWNRGPRETSLN